MEPTTPTTTQDTKKIPGRFVALFVSIVIVAMLGFYSVLAPKTLPVEGSVFTVEAGDSLKSIGTKLVNRGFIRSRVVFANAVVLFGGEKHIAPGDYYVAGGESVIAIARQLAQADHNINPIKVTIPEGMNVREIADLLVQKIPSFDKIDFLQKALPYEGTLFPETYFVYPKTSVDAIITQMRTMFTQKTQNLFGQKKSLYTENQIITMASIIEREAHGDDDRSIIASILWSRFNQGMRLQVDASVAYGQGIAESQLQKSDLVKLTPYNTYLVKGLPPTPIANPGILALTAALNPTPTPYLYYLHDKHGTIHYAKTYAEHQKNINKYLK